MGNSESSEARPNAAIFHAHDDPVATSAWRQGCRDGKTAALAWSHDDRPFLENQSRFRGLALLAALPRPPASKDASGRRQLQNPFQDPVCFFPGVQSQAAW